MMLGHHAIAPAQLWRTWNTEPAVVLPLVTVAVGYVWGWRRSRRRRRAELAAFASGLVALAVALVSPVDAAAVALLSMHMIQHLVLIVVAAPLLVLGRPLVYLPAALPAGVRRGLLRSSARHGLGRAAGVAMHPIVVSAVAVVVLWAWHLPTLYETALVHHPFHALEHITLLASAGAVWAVALGATRRRSSEPARMLVLFVAGLSGAALGAVLTFAGYPLYPVHSPTARLWEVSPLADQQVAGAIMWVGPGIVYLAVIAVVLARWLAGASPEPPLSTTTAPGRVS